MALKDIKFLSYWINGNSLAIKILSSKLNCTQNEIKTLLNDLSTSVDNQLKVNEPQKQQVNKLTLKKR